MPAQRLLHEGISFRLYADEFEVGLDRLEGERNPRRRKPLDSCGTMASPPRAAIEPEPAGPFPRFRAFPGERHHGNGRLRPDRALPAGNALRAQREPDQGDREIRWLVRVRDARLVADRSRSCPARSPGGGTCRSDAGLQQTARAFDTEGHHTCAENDKEERPRPRTRAPRRTTNKRSLGLSARFIRISSKPP
jgi:hypothetical protein